MLIDRALVERAVARAAAAGSGSVMEALRMNKALLVVINEKLMDNHQAELATKVCMWGGLWAVCNLQLSMCTGGHEERWV